MEMTNDELFIYPRPDLSIYLLNPCRRYILVIKSAKTSPAVSLSIQWIAGGNQNFPLAVGKVSGMSQSPRGCGLGDFFFSPSQVMGNESSISDYISVFSVDQVQASMFV